MNVLTEELLNQYKQNGYLTVKGLFSPESLLSVISDMNKVIANQLVLLNIKPSEKTNQDQLFENLKLLLDKDVKAYLNYLRHIPKLVSLQALTSSSKLIGLAEDFGLQQITTPTSPVVHVSSDQLKIPGGYFGVGEHQDWTSIQGGLKSIVVWIPFMEILEKTFPLEILPKSHLKGILKGQIESNSYTVCPTQFNENDFMRATASFGDVVVMSVMTLHRTGLANCHGFRLACSMRYEDSMESDFILRGYPCAYQRTVNREFITPNYPSLSDVKKCF